jgi:hypothetical protein
MNTSDTQWHATCEQSRVRTVNIHGPDLKTPSPVAGERNAPTVGEPNRQLVVVWRFVLRQLRHASSPKVHDPDMAGGPGCVGGESSVHLDGEPAAITRP